MTSDKNSLSTGLMGHDNLDDYHDQILSYETETRHDKWSVSWSDLMMTMFIFFAVLYVYQTGNRDLLFGKGPGQNQISEEGANRVLDITAGHDASHIYDQARQAISEVMFTEPSSVELMENGAVRIVLAGDLLFDPGKAELRIGARYQLDQIARVLNETEYLINVVGHTDDSPTRSERYPTNWELSANRAVMVARYLTEVTGVDAARIKVSAWSFYQAVRPNDTSENRALNRRVEIILEKQLP